MAKNLLNPLAPASLTMKSRIKRARKGISKRAKKDKKVLIQERDSKLQSWFEETLLDEAISELGEDEESLRGKWSKMSIKTKKKIQKKWKLLKVKEWRVVMLKTGLLFDVASMFYKGAHEEAIAL